VDLCVLSAAPESSSSGFATSLAAILGILARQPTLLVDLSNQPQQTRNALDIHDARGTETLVDQYIRTHAMTADDVRQQIVSYSIALTQLRGPRDLFGSQNTAWKLFVSAMQGSRHESHAALGGAIEPRPFDFLDQAMSA
jgi:hypothetical protein